MSQIRPTPLTEKPLKRAVRKVRIEPMSQKREDDKRLYDLVKKFMLKARPYCEFPTCCSPSFDIHHVKGTLGDYYLNPIHMKMLCREHHTFIHENGRWARENGWLQ